MYQCSHTFLIGEHPRFVLADKPNPIGPNPRSSSKLKGRKSDVKMEKNRRWQRRSLGDTLTHRCKDSQCRMQGKVPSSFLQREVKGADSEPLLRGPKHSSPARKRWSQSSFSASRSLFPLCKMRRTPVSASQMCGRTRRRKSLRAAGRHLNSAWPTGSGPGSTCFRS